LYYKSYFITIVDAVIMVINIVNISVEKNLFLVRLLVFNK